MFNHFASCSLMFLGSTNDQLFVRIGGLDSWNPLMKGIATWEYLWNLKPPTQTNNYYLIGAISKEQWLQPTCCACPGETWAACSACFSRRKAREETCYFYESGGWWWWWGGEWWHYTQARCRATGVNARTDMLLCHACASHIDISQLTCVETLRVPHACRRCGTSGGRSWRRVGCPRRTLTRRPTSSSCWRAAVHRRGKSGKRKVTFCLTYLLTFFLTYLLTFFLTYLLTYLLTFFLTVILTYLVTVFLTYLLSFCLTLFLAYLVTFFLTFLLTFFRTFFLTFLLTFFLKFFVTVCLTDLLTFFLTDLLTLFLTFFFWHSFWHSSFWHISRLRSGAEHWPHRIAVEVRRGTLNSQDRGGGPARNAGLTGSRLRSGTERWTHRIAVEVRHGTLSTHHRSWWRGRQEDAEKEERRGEERRGGEEQVDIKSNNPHLTGGESFGSFGDGKFSGAMLNFQGVVIHSFALQQPMLSCRVRRCLSWRAGWNWREVLEMWYMVENIKRAGPSKRLCQGSLNYPFWGIKQCKCSGRIFFVCRDSP